MTSPWHDTECHITTSINCPISLMKQMLQTQSWCRFHHIRGWGTRKWWNYLCRTCAWPRKWLWRHYFRDHGSHISSNTNDRRSILVSILPYSRLINSKMMKLFMWNSRVTWKVTMTSRFAWPVVFLLIQITQDRYRCRFYHIRGWGTRKWLKY